MERKWWTLIAVCVAIFMLLLDITVVNVALPSIQRSLHSSFQDLQWVVDAYSLTLAAFLLTGGALADLLGRRLLFTIGLVVFTASSVVCGLSTTPLMLNLARGVQGVGGALMFATSLALIAQAFHGRERGTAFGIFGAVTGAAVAAGPLIGGVITSAIGWEWIFFVNAPIGVVAVAVTLTQVDESRDPSATGVDWAGLVTFSGSLFLLVFALVRGNGLGWGSTEIVAMLAGAVVLLALFVLAERMQERPMLDLSLFKRPAFVGANLVAFTLSSSAFAMFLYLTLYIQDVLRYSPLQAGLRFLPTTLLMFFVSPLSGRLSVRVPIRALLGVGLLFVAAGLLAMTAVTPTSSWTALIPGFVLQGIGVGLINPPLASAAVGVVPPARSGMASGANSTFRQVGIATGIAALGAIFQADLGGGGGEAAVQHASRAAFVGAFTSILEVAAAVAAVGAVAAFALVRSKDFVASQAPVESGRPEPVAPEPGAPGCGGAIGRGGATRRRALVARSGGPRPRLVARAIAHR